MTPIVSFAQLDKEEKNRFRIMSSFHRYSGVGAEIGYEYFFTPKQSVILSSMIYNTTKGFSLGYRYNFLSYKKMDIAAGLDFRRQNFTFNTNHSFSKEWRSSLSMTVELKYYLKNNFSIIGGISTNIIDKSKDYLLMDRISLGCTYGF